MINGSLRCSKVGNNFQGELKVRENMERDQILSQNLVKPQQFIYVNI